MILVIDCGSSKFPDILSCLHQAGAETLPVKAGDAEGPVDKVKGIVISGSPFLLSKEISPLQKGLAWIKDCNIPVLGICFGHQLLGLLYGGSVYLGPEIRKAHPVTIHHKEKLFSGFGSTESFAQDHTEGLIPPSGFEILASSVYYPAEAVRHPHKPHYGVQFHPETSGKNGSKLFRNFLKLC